MEHARPTDEPPVTGRGATPVRPRLAATVLVARDGQSGPEVLMLRRHGRSGFAADAWVFPGGTLDPPDATLPAPRWRGIDPEALAPRFALDPDVVLGMHVAAVRETFEEAGLLLARHCDGRDVDLGRAEVRTMRAALAAREADAGAFAAWLADEDLVCDLDRLTYLVRWITPAQEPRRFDTCFFLARAPLRQVADHDRVETTGQRWVRPHGALSEQRAGRFHMIFPTVRTLEELADAPTVAAMVGRADAQEGVRTLQPHIETDADGRYVRLLHPDDPEYPWDRYPELRP